MSAKAKPAARKSKRPPYSDLVILFFLYEGESQSGYSMKRLLADTRVDEWLPVSNMTVYQSFKRLERDGCVVSETIQQSNYPDRTVYTITEGGKAYFEKWQRHEIQNFERDFFHFDIGIGLGSYTSHAETVAAAELRIGQLHDRLSQVKADIANYPSSTRSPFPRWLLLDHERSYLINEIRWMRRFIKLKTEQDERRLADGRSDSPA